MVSKAYRDVLTHGGHEVFIYARGGELHAKGDPAWDGPEVTWDAGSNRPDTNVRWSQFAHWIRKHRLDLLFFNEQQYWPVVVFVRQQFNIPIGSYVDYYTSLTVPFFGLYDFLVCNTRRHASVFNWHPQSLYVPWGTDCDLFQPGSPPRTPNPVVFFHSAGMNPSRKGTEVALGAFTQTKGNCRFLLHIQASLDKFPKIKRLSEADSRIDIVNEMVPPPGLYNRGDVYVYPTILEGIGLTIMEALASGLPVITTDSPPMNEFVTHGVNGWLATPSDYRGRWDGYYWAEAHCQVDEVARILQKCVSNPATIADAKIQARHSAVASFNWKKNAAKLPEQLEQALAQGRSKTNQSALEARAISYSRRSRFYQLADKLAEHSGLARIPGLLARIQCR